MWDVSLWCYDEADGIQNASEMVWFGVLSIRDSSERFGLIHLGESLLKPPNPQRYAKVPMQVLTDTRISPIARVVYSFLAGCAFDGPRVRVGQRFVAESVGASQPTIHRCLKELAKAGHLEPVLGPCGKRSAYDLKSPVFSYTRARRFTGGLTSTVRAAKAWATRDEDLIQ